MLKIGIVCYPTYGGSGVLATELGKALAKEGHHVHFITYKEPARLDAFNPRIFYHEVSFENYSLFEYPPYETALASKMVDIAQFENLDILHVHYAIPHASAAFIAKQIWKSIISLFHIFRGSERAKHASITIATGEADRRNL